MVIIIIHLSQRALGKKFEFGVEGRDEMWRGNEDAVQISTLIGQD